MSQHGARVDTAARPFAGLRVLVTRPVPQADNLCQQLRLLGAEPVRFPTLKITPISESESGYQNLKNAFLNLDQYHAVIFVSGNAARMAHQWIDQYWPQLPVDIDWLAVGSATTQALQQCHIPVFCQHPTGSLMDSETLLQLPRLQQLTDQKILICRGQGGRELLAETLHQRGAIVDYAELYRREIPVYSQAEIESIIYKPAASAMLVSSAEALTNLVTLTRTETTGNVLTKIKLIVPSQRVAELAIKYQFKQIKIAANATDDAMLTALQAITV
jgi:uroporphyrinogen-III synthase